MFRRIVLALPVLGLARPAAAAWPERPVTLVVPFGAGSAPDLLARLLADPLAATWGQPVVVQNVPGASATLGVDRVARAAPDGYTLGFTGDGAMVVRVSMDPPPLYDPRRDLVPVSLLLRTRNVLVVHPSVAATNLPELLALARARPGALAYGHSGVGFSTHLGMEMLKQVAGVDITAVPYGAEAPMLADLLAGRVQVMIGSSAMTDRVRAGEVRAIAVTSRDRMPALPDVPTIAEAGLPGFEAVAWFGLIAPARTPPEIAAWVRRDAVATLDDPRVRPRLAELGLTIVGSTPEEFAALIPTEIERMAGVLRPLGLLRTP
ncbi:Bug family tripartite tricarboxylate transporter substrate binding protein [Muricoccus radiodurans]|uniref:Bug family tripartite tricarboxylate transporter substrate binding protein n=1 Tax=Muricoccus radiodurans TaxID=2231721 RepID=UPI003CF56580